MSAHGGSGKKGQQRHLGSFGNAADAARVYDRAVLHLRGDAAETNYPRAQYLEVCVRAVCVCAPCAVCSLYVPRCDAGVGQRS